MSQMLEQRSREYREYIESYLADWYDRFSDEPQKKLFEAMKEVLKEKAKGTDNDIDN